MNRSDGKPKVYNKSYKTKWKIGMTLMNILDRKPLDKIRVQEICDSADIHRSTFYKHFSSVFDVVSFMTEEITGELTAQMDHADRRQDYMDSLVNYYVKYGRALRNLFQTKYREILELQMQTTLEQYYMKLLKLMKPDIDKDMPLKWLARYHAAGIMAVGISLWDEEMDEKRLREKLPVFYQNLF